MTTNALRGRKWNKPDVRLNIAEWLVQAKASLHNRLEKEDIERQSLRHFRIKEGLRQPLEELLKRTR